MVVTHDAVDAEPRLVSDTQSALAEYLQRLRLRRQHHLPHSLVPRLHTRYLVDDHLRCILQQYILTSFSRVE